MRKRLDEELRGRGSDCNGVRILRYPVAWAGGLRRITEFAERVAAGDLSARIQEDSSDEIAHVASALDKTARKLEDGFRALETSRQTLETLLNSMQEPVIAVAPDGRVLWANQRMERLLPSGIRLGEPLVQSARDPEILRAVQHALDARDVSLARAAKIFSGRIFDLTAAPMPGGGAVAVLHDQTEIERVEKTRRDFIANVSHELRTPLTSIQGYCRDPAGKRRHVPTQSRDFLEIIRKNAARMSRLTEDLLVLARVESGERNFNYEMVSPQELLQRSGADLSRRSAESRGIELSVINTAASSVFVDRDAIHQVFANLMENALKYGESGKKIIVGACETEDGVQFFVRDFGEGIRQRAPAPALRTLLPGRQGALARIRRYRAGTGDRQARGSGPRRIHQGRERAEPRRHLLLHPASPGSRRRTSEHRLNKAHPGSTEES